MKAWSSPDESEIVPGSVPKSEGSLIPLKQCILSGSMHRCIIKNRCTTERRNVTFISCIFVQLIFLSPPSLPSSKDQ